MDPHADIGYRWVIQDHLLISNSLHLQSPFYNIRSHSHRSGMGCGCPWGTLCSLQHLATEFILSSVITGMFNVCYFRHTLGVRSRWVYSVFYSQLWARCLAHHSDQKWCLTEGLFPLESPVPSWGHRAGIKTRPIHGKPVLWGQKQGFYWKGCSFCASGHILAAWTQLQVVFSYNATALWHGGHPTNNKRIKNNIH